MLQDFIALVGYAAAGEPLAARAATVDVSDWLSWKRFTGPLPEMLAAFHRGLKEASRSDGATIEYW